MSAVKKSVLYVGGLDPSVSEEVLHAAFIPFGELKSVQIPRDYQSNKHRGFGFVEFDIEEDALAALENMDGAELFGRVIRCAHAKAMTKLTAGKAVWDDEEWIKSQLDQDAGGLRDELASSDVVLMPSREVDDEQQ